MTPSQQLAELERQRTEEVRTLHFTYLRTKREVKRAIDPTRLVRKHLPLSLAAGAALGLLLAPRPSPRPINDEVVDRAVRNAHRQNSRRGFSLTWIRKLLTKFSPDLAQFIPEESPTPEQKIHEEAEQIREEAKKEGKKQQKSESPAPLLRLLESFLPILLSKIDSRTLLNQFMHTLHEKTTPPSNNRPEPEVSVADAGTIKPHDFDNFE